MSGAARIERALCSGADTQRPRLVSFLTAGYPSMDEFEALLPRVAAVCDAVEIGVPFSDPMADGVTVQAASHAALAGGVTLRWILQVVARAQLDTPLLLMSYLNPLLAYGPAALARDAAAAGVSGFIVPDLPLEEQALLRPLADAGLALVQLVTPLTDAARMAQLCAASRGFVYAVTRTGTTGGDTALPDGIAAYLDRIRAASAVPVMAGFGIHCAGQVRALAGHADGAIVGSALIRTIQAGADPVAFLRGLRP